MRFDSASLYDLDLNLKYSYGQVSKLAVRRPWRRRGIARRMHDLLLRDRPEERATLTARPDAYAAQAAYATWGWRKVAQKTNPLPGDPVYDILIKPLKAGTDPPDGP